MLKYITVWGVSRMHASLVASQSNRLRDILCEILLNTCKITLYHSILLLHITIYIK